MIVVEEQNMSLTQRLWGIIMEPVKTFQDICKDPRILITAAAVLAINLVLTTWFLPQIKEITEEALKQAQTMTTEQIQATLKWTGIAAVIGSVAVPPLTWLVQAALLALFNQFSLGAAKFKQLFAVAFYAWIPAFLGGLIKSAFMAVMGVKDAMTFSTSLALILPRSVDSGFWYVFLSKVDFFNVWSLILLVLGGSIAMQKDSKKLTFYIFGIWLVFIILTSLLGAQSNTAGV